MAKTVNMLQLERLGKWAAAFARAPRAHRILMAQVEIAKTRDDALRLRRPPVTDLKS